jgi:hypothetical protein
MDTDVMVDFTHSAVGNVPNSSAFEYVAGYTSGTSNIEWTAADWAKYTQQHHIRIEQGYGGFSVARSTYDMLDMETGAWTPAGVVSAVNSAITDGYEYTTVYAVPSGLQTLAGLMTAEEIASTDCVVANWNLNQTQAAALVGTKMYGFLVRGVQWASPTSNPNTILPGTSLTLRQANVDLNEVQAGWVPSVPRGTLPTPPPGPPSGGLPVVTQLPVIEMNHAGLVVWQDGADFYVREVTSTDGGQNWS